MAAGSVITVLSNIPWGQVIDAAPRLAEGAGRLGEAAKNLRKSKSAPPDAAAPSTANPPTDAEQLKARVCELEGTVQELREQMQASAEVIKDLANQNSLLVQRVEISRSRLVRLAIACAACLLALAAATVHLWFAR